MSSSIALFRLNICPKVLSCLAISGVGLSVVGGPSAFVGVLGIAVLVVSVALHRHSEQLRSAQRQSEETSDTEKKAMAEASGVGDSGTGGL
ncbi:hypothetical protein ACFQKC_05235 [Halovenus rubra]